MFIDEAHLKVKAGTGGAGRAMFFPGIKTGPSGGDGGRGGNVYVMADPSLADLYAYSKNHVYKADNGKIGENFKRTGAAGKDFIIKVPKGTLFIDQETKESFEVTEYDKHYLLATGGHGGKGNAKFATPTNRSPKTAQPGKPGQEKNYKMVLKLIAYFGLIGLPNAGKSSLLNELTQANVKTAMYPFTTLEPNLGVFHDKVIADIPGLIEGASGGKGLGFKFLKHVEKVEVLLHCIASDSADIMADFETVITELKNYNEELLKKKQVILLTKTDLIDEATQKKYIQLLSKKKKQVVSISIFNIDQFTELQRILSSL